MRSIIALYILWALSGQPVFSQQPHGEFHKFVLKKADDERRKTKSKEWWGTGVICFSSEEIPRLGTVAEVQPLLKTSFEEGDKFVGRVYAMTHLGGLPGGMPDEIEYRIIEKGKVLYRVGLKGEALPEAEWSSWLIDLPADLQKGFDDLGPGDHSLRIEVWSGREEEVLTEWKDKETDKTVGYTKDKENRGKFLASGELVYEKEGETEEEATEETEGVAEEMTEEVTEEVVEEGAVKGYQGQEIIRYWEDWDNGKTKFEYQFYEGEHGEKINAGFYREYYESGQLAHEENYNKEGQLDGKQVDYDEKGQVKKESVYTNGTCVSGCE